MKRLALLPASALLGLALAVGTLTQSPSARTAAPASPTSGGSSAETTRQLSVANKPWKGDFDAMLERRMHRVSVPYSRSLYFIDKGHERGIAAELIRDFERWVNQKYAKKLGKRPLTVYHRRNHARQAAPRPERRVADIAVGNLTVTEERLKVVDFVAPDEKLVNVEILVTGPASPADRLAGRSLGQERARAQVIQLPREPDRVERAVEESRQGPKPSSSWFPMRSKTRTCWR